MKSPLTLRRRRTRRWLTAAVAAPLIAFAAGCASPAPPQPPSLNLPETVKDLTAQRMGDLVSLHWTTPETTTDRLPIKGAMTAEICRITITSTPSSPCVPFTRLPVQPGPAHASDTLPATLTAEPATLLAYRIKILNSNRRSADPSPEAFAAAGEAPPPVDQLRATPTRDGAMLEWQQKATPAAVELDRLPIGPNGVVLQPPPPKAAKSSTKPATKKPAPAKTSAPKTTTPKTTTPKPFQAAPPVPIEVKLRTPTQSTDSGGTIDHTARMGESYRYTAQRVRSVTLGGHTLELRSAISPPVTVVMRNTFPPHAPTGLEAVPGGATPSGRSPNPPNPSIDLSWTPNTDPDLAGYSVYRQEIDAKGVAAGTATRLNATPVVGPAYRDQTAMAGRRYAYRVTAVDTAGNESAPSDAVQETLREQ